MATQGPSPCFHRIRQVWIAKQRENQDLILRAGEDMACHAAWPVQANGVKVPAAELLDWLRTYGYAWACFCRKGSGRPMPLAEFTTLPDGTVLVHCGRPYSCGFELNLTRIENNTILTSRFASLPFQPSEAQYSDYLKTHTDFRAFVEGAAEDLAFFTGFIGMRCPVPQPEADVWPRTGMHV